ncbi:methyltransferase-like protein 27 [Oratosquilla oratoria]|uniref:methyltransferase-like protein 27 n=1 Tax=Oratosquilla oratoria TaxID=337810 RepID=UPI003F770BC6
MVIIGFEGVKMDDASAYKANYKCHEPGISPSKMASNYSEWAQEYDKDLCPGRYNGPQIAAAALAKIFSEDTRGTVNVLDVAAGTGRVGIEAYKLGFRRMDALDPSQGMIKILEETKVYNKKYVAYVGIGQNDISSDKYDAVVVAGGMGEGHIPIEGLDDMIRVVKPGGYVCIVMREEYLQYVEQYKDKLEPYMQRMEKENKWKMVGRDIVENYSFNKNGIVFTFRKI